MKRLRSRIQTWAGPVMDPTVAGVGAALRQAYDEDARADAVLETLIKRIDNLMEGEIEHARSGQG